MTAPSKRRLVVVGDALLDRDVAGVSERRSPDAGAPVLEGCDELLRPGGAGLAAALAAREGPVTLIAAFAADAAGEQLSRVLLAAGVDLVQLRLDGGTPEKVRFLDGERPLMRLDRGAGAVVAGGETPALRTALAAAGAVLVSDYGRGVAASAAVRAALAGRPAGVPLVWDPHPRGAAPLPGAELATPNLAEARALAGAAPGPAPGPPPGGAEARPAALARALAARWRAAAVCVTRGAEGATLADAAGRAEDFAATAAAGDTCGAGDRFAAAAARALAVGASAGDAVRAAISAATDYVASSGARTASVPAARLSFLNPRRERLSFLNQGLREDNHAAGGLRNDNHEHGGRGGDGQARGAAAGVVERVRAAGGTVVATGGCFDLLHVGHVRTLEAARGFGDCLVVLLNGDGSVRGLKGADRPLVGEEERAETLRALACVDAVMIFDEPDPTEALRHLQPDVWCKGGDYLLDELPEAEAIATWGGRIAILPYLEGRSTTNLIAEVNARA
ncbi:MAG: PfkB family carbohydrate kinase [Solirubrobacterales bacterium]